MAKDDKEDEKHFVDRGLEQITSQNERHSSMSPKYSLLEARFTAEVLKEKATPSQPFSNLDIFTQREVLYRMSSEITPDLHSEYQRNFEEVKKSINNKLASDLATYQNKAKEEYHETEKDYKQKQNDFIYASVLQGQEDGRYTDEDVKAILKMANLPPLQESATQQIRIMPEQPPMTGIGSRQEITSTKNKSTHSYVSTPTQHGTEKHDDLNVTGENSRNNKIKVENFATQESPTEGKGPEEDKNKTLISQPTYYKGDTLTLKDATTIHQQLQSEQATVETEPSKRQSLARMSNLGKKPLNPLQVNELNNNSDTAPENIGNKFDMQTIAETNKIVDNLLGSNKRRPTGRQKDQDIETSIKNVRRPGSPNEPDGFHR